MDKKFKLSFEVGFVLDGNISDGLIDVVLESIKLDVKNALDKNASLCSNLIHSKNIDVVEVDSSDVDVGGGD